MAPCLEGNGKYGRKERVSSFSKKERKQERKKEKRKKERRKKERKKWHRVYKEMASMEGKKG